ncbi:MAG: oligoendopeptidase pepF/M3 family [Acidimicrobiales bacterium]|jgi:oligoendopeptidase F|nr:oligoendopeptidase pepF/M3 family [Acidimicrobiales bacterium]
MTVTDAAPASGAEGVRWDLTPLYVGPDDPALEADLTTAGERAKAFAERYRGRVAELAADDLAAAIAELEGIEEQIGKVATFAFLHYCTDTRDPARGALLQKVEERGTAIGTDLLFFGLEWANAPDDHVAEVLADPALADRRHWLESARRFRPHLLSEPEEKVMAEKSVTGRSAWARLFTEVTDTIDVELDGDTVSLETALSVLHDGDRAKRQRAGQAVTAALRGTGLATRTFIFNTVASDQSIDDRLRNYRSWIESRNLGNEIDDATVEALVGSVTSRYDIVARWYRLKAKLLGLDELNEYDRYAPLELDEGEVGFEEAKRIVLDAYRSFAPEMADIAEAFFHGYIDAPVMPGKQGGAFAHPAVPSAHPYVLLNYTARRRDVMTMAHELGHGVHQVLASKLGLFNADTPLTLAETASIFGETVTFHRLLADVRDPKQRLGLLAGRIEDVTASVFRQIAMNRFEDAVHTIRRNEGELSPDRFKTEWLRTQRAMFQDSVTLTDDYGVWWSYIPHFIHTPGYVYAYAFGNLLTLAIYARYEAEGASFVPQYLALLSAGGSDSPEQLAKLVGVDLSDPGFWSAGLDVVEEMVTEAETLAAAV